MFVRQLARPMARSASIFRSKAFPKTTVMNPTGYSRSFASEAHSLFIEKDPTTCQEGIESGCLDTLDHELSQAARKPGVVSNGEMDAFLEKNWQHTLVLDVRNSNFDEEPGDRRTVDEMGGSFPSGDCAPGAVRPNSVNIPWNRGMKSMDLDNSAFKNKLLSGHDTAIITHCGGGGRGEQARKFLAREGFTNVINGGGPEVAELWARFGKI